VIVSEADQVRENEEMIAKKKNERVKRINQIREQKEMERRVEKEIEKNNRGISCLSSCSAPSELSGTKNTKYYQLRVR
jgi:hypothetical protein